MAKQKEIERPLSAVNAVIYGKIVGLELALLECNQLGIDIECVDFTDHGHPSLIARANNITQQMLRQGKAVNYGHTFQNGHRIYLHYAMISGVKVKWKSTDYRH
ncbi:hypothetical protein [Actinobacillus suis]|uniref:Uncharacterized protein n=1 Tax=Actinobacillus suis TaxID=716 RepID=A0ABT1WS92_ACTSU|nr:hypothetical protein [Actinobacillus suis]MCQ9629268.1 hypothetical protein [Actinobacillus suis]MCQ9632318.1 hypothetical protein [Actinobacillus suis]